MSDPLSEEQKRGLASLLDQIIPPSSDGRMPGAGEAGLVAHFEEVLESSPDLLPVIRQFLAALDRLGGEEHGEPFAALAPPEQAAVLEAVAAAQPALVPGLVFHTYAAYYRNARVLEALGLEARPPYPKGYEMEADDWSRLERVRAAAAREER